MAQKVHTLEEIRKLAQEDGRYHTEAFLLVFEALDYTLKKIGRHRHISGRELLQGMVEFLLEQCGPIAYFLLTKWGVRETSDIGLIVFLLVERGLLSRTEEDSLDDFKDVFPLKDALSNGYRFPTDLHPLSLET